MLLPLVLRSAARGAVRGLKRGRVGTRRRRQTVWVEVVRSVLAGLGRLPLTESRFAFRIPPLADDFEEDAVSLGGVDCLRWTPPNVRTEGVFVHFHGGGYVFGTAATPRPHVVRVLREAGCVGYGVEYRLAPEHPCPAAVDDGYAVIKALLSAGHAPGSIVVGGDSAGGGLTLALLLRLRDEGILLGGGQLGSPWVDVRTPGESRYSNAERDFVPDGVGGRWAEAYAGDRPQDDLVVSPGLADPTGLPPLQIVAGEAERLRDDVLAFADRARAAGVDVDLVVGDDAVHCWYLDAKFPGPPDTWRAMGSFVADRLSR